MDKQNFKHIETFQHTKEELESPTYLTWDNARIGEAVKLLAKDLGEYDIKGWESISTMAAAFVLIELCIKTNSESYTQNIGGFSNNSKREEISNWKITVEKIG